LDSITEFLKSPVWKNPIVQFIDENCASFDCEEENKLEYTEIHNKFKTLVDTKLNGFMTDFGIPADSFLMACELASQKVHKSIVKQLLAVEDFLVFKKMMNARNKQLNEEAMKQLKPTDGGEQQKKVDAQLAAKMKAEREKAEKEQALAEEKALEEKRKA